MILRNTYAYFKLKCPSGKRETEAFHWIRKESDVARYVSGMDFTYQDGFTVKFCVPIDWTNEQLSEKVDRTCLEFHRRFVAIKEFP